MLGIGTSNGCGGPGSTHAGGVHNTHEGVYNIHGGGVGEKQFIVGQVKLDGNRASRAKSRSAYAVLPAEVA